MNYETKWANLNKKLRQSAEDNNGLASALFDLENHQRKTGFIKDDLKKIKRIVFRDPNNKSYSLRAQINPKRAKRHGGSGNLALAGEHPNINNGCFLCRENIKWQQEERQIGFEINFGISDYIAFMNPFPLLPNHVVIASTAHRTQELRLFQNDEQNQDLALVLSDLCELADRLPNHIGFYNGVGAGASIPDHFHFQFFQRAPDLPKFPLEERRFSNIGCDFTTTLVEDYPLCVFRWMGELGEVVEKATSWITNFVKTSKFERQQLTANFIASRSMASKTVTLYFVPRHRFKQFWNGNAGIVGGLEILGEIVLASNEECNLVRYDIMNFEFIERGLSHISAPFTTDKADEL